MVRARAKATEKTHFWTDEETRFMLLQLKELNILKYMDGRRTRNGHLFKKVAEKMQDAGCKRTAEQVRVRWKHLKQNYSNSKKQNQTGGLNRVQCPFSDLLEELLGGRTLFPAEENGEDIGFPPVGFSPSTSESVLGAEDLDDTMEVSQQAEDDSEVEGISTPQHPRTTSTPTPDAAGTTTINPARRRRGAQNMDTLFQRLEEINTSLRQHLRESGEREERLVQRIIDSNASLVSALLEGIQSLRPPTHPHPTMSPHPDSTVPPHSDPIMPPHPDPTMLPQPLIEHIKDEE
ncbi:uncharacterized protein LOC131475368 [Solea solea]|uniref:uncharacterized protein LOC131475368 n=1 Tax=Solea solea TaxID=90069 RepID=UPI00272AD0EE|nr:uncharacterized protein LOC131475368 [Solea solea]